MSVVEMVAWRDDMLGSLRAWQEPAGILCGTEPDPGEREACRSRLRVAIDVLNRILAG